MANESSRALGYGDPYVNIAAGKYYDVVPKDLGQPQLEFSVENFGKTTDAKTLPGLQASVALLFLQDNSGDTFASVLPTLPVRFRTDGQFRIYNPGSASVDVVIGQIILSGTLSSSGRASSSSSSSSGGGGGGGGGEGGNLPRRQIP